MAEDINISPEMINNMVNMLKNSGISNNSSPDNDNNSSNSSINFNDIISKITNSSDSTNNENSNASTENNTTNIDFETILKIKSIMETLNNKNDPRSNLLYSLKPYLRKSKQSKLDQYANLLKITQVTGLFKNEKGESK